MPIQHSDGRAEEASPPTGGLDRLKGDFSRLYADFQRRSRFFRLRFWIVLAYGLIVTTSVVMAMPARNVLGAYPLLVPDPADRHNVIVSVENQSRQTWTNVRFILDDLYEFERKEIPGGGRAQLHAVRFQRAGTTDRDGRPPSGYRPGTLTVRSDQGTFKTKFKK